MNNINQGFTLSPRSSTSPMPSYAYQPGNLPMNNKLSKGKLTRASKGHSASTPHPTRSLKDIYKPVNSLGVDSSNQDTGGSLFNKNLSYKTMADFTLLTSPAIGAIGGTVLGGIGGALSGNEEDSFTDRAGKIALGAGLGAGAGATLGYGAGRFTRGMKPLGQSPTIQTPGKVPVSPTGSTPPPGGTTPVTTAPTSSQVIMDENTRRLINQHSTRKSPLQSIGSVADEVAPMMLNQNQQQSNNSAYSGQRAEFRLLSPLATTAGLGVVGAGIGALTADEDATWRDRFDRASIGAAIGSSTGLVGSLGVNLAHKTPVKQNVPPTNRSQTNRATPTVTPDGPSSATVTPTPQVGGDNVSPSPVAQAMSQVDTTPAVSTPTQTPASNVITDQTTRSLLGRHGRGASTSSTPAPSATTPSPSQPVEPTSNKYFRSYNQKQGDQQIPSTPPAPSPDPNTTEQAKRRKLGDIPGASSLRGFIPDSEFSYMGNTANFKGTSNFNLGVAAALGGGALVGGGIGAAYGVSQNKAQNYMQQGLIGAIPDENIREQATEVYESLPIRAARTANDTGNVIRTAATGGAIGLAAGGLGLGALQILKNRGR